MKSTLIILAIVCSLVYSNKLEDVVTKCKSMEAPVPLCYYIVSNGLKNTASCNSIQGYNQKLQQNKLTLENFCDSLKKDAQLQQKLTGFLITKVPSCGCVAAQKPKISSDVKLTEEMKDFAGKCGEDNQEVVSCYIFGTLKEQSTKKCITLQKAQEQLNNKELDYQNFCNVVLNQQSSLEKLLDSQYDSAQCGCKKYEMKKLSENEQKALNEKVQADNKEFLDSCKTKAENGNQCYLIATAQDNTSKRLCKTIQEFNSAVSLNLNEKDFCSKAFENNAKIAADILQIKLSALSCGCYALEQSKQE